MRLDLTYELERGLEYYPDFEEFYPPLDHAIIEHHEKHGDLYYGRNVVWLTSGTVIRAYPDFSYAIQGNIFYPDKLAAVYQGINESEGRVHFYAPYGAVSLITEEDVEESQRAEIDGYLYDSYGISIPYDEEDIGEYIVQLRDGNHRAWGAFLAGEPYVYVNVIEDYSMDNVHEFTE
jgi:hypothetical protein